MEPAARRHLLLVLSAIVGLLGTAFSQSEGLSSCNLPNQARIGELLMQAVSGRIGEGFPVVTTLANFHYTCQALGDRVGLFRSLSVAVIYNETTREMTNTRVSQIQLTCSNGLFEPAPQVPLQTFRNQSLLFSLPTRRDCRACIAGEIEGIDTDANCLCE